MNVSPDEWYLLSGQLNILNSLNPSTGGFVDARSLPIDGLLTYIFIKDDISLVIYFPLYYLINCTDLTQLSVGAFTDVGIYDGILLNSTHFVLSAS